MTTPVPDAEAAFVARMADLGVSWRWFVTDGALASGSARALRERRVVEDDEAAMEHVARVARQCGLELSTAAATMIWRPSSTDADQFAGRIAPTLAAITEAAETLRGQRPVFVVDGHRTSFDEVAHVVGTEALTWHLLGQDGRVPARLTIPAATLASRLDVNPLALVRRAHAACARASAASPVEHAPQASDVTTLLALTGQIERERHRTGRLKPVIRHVDTLAAAVLQHLERTPVTRTDALAVNAARRVLADALAAAGLAAPVPY